MAGKEYFWCTKHQKVESGDNLCPARYLIGPFPTVSEAEHALERIQQRNEAWEAENARWEGKGR